MSSRSRNACTHFKDVVLDQLCELVRDRQNALFRFAGRLISARIVHVIVIASNADAWLVPKMKLLHPKAEQFARSHAGDSIQLDDDRIPQLDRRIAERVLVAPDGDDFPQPLDHPWIRRLLDRRLNESVLGPSWAVLSNALAHLSQIVRKLRRVAMLDDDAAEELQVVRDRRHAVVGHSLGHRGTRHRRAYPCIRKGHHVARAHFGVFSSAHISHVQLREIAQRHDVWQRKERPTRELVNEVASFLHLPSKEHLDVRESVSNRIDGRSGVAQLRRRKERRVEHRKPLIVQQKWHALTLIHHAHRKRGHKVFFYIYYI